MKLIKRKPKINIAASNDVNKAAGYLRDELFYNTYDAIEETLKTEPEYINIYDCKINLLQLKMKLKALVGLEDGSETLVNIEIDYKDLSNTKM